MGNLLGAVHDVLNGQFVSENARMCIFRLGWDVGDADRNRTILGEGMMPICLQAMQIYLAAVY